MMQIGIVSAGDTSCRPEIGQVFTDVGAMGFWIKQNHPKLYHSKKD